MSDDTTAKLHWQAADRAREGYMILVDEKEGNEEIGVAEHQWSSVAPA